MGAWTGAGGGKGNGGGGGGGGVGGESMRSPPLNSCRAVSTGQRENGVDGIKTCRLWVFSLRLGHF